MQKDILSNIVHPTIILDERKCKANIMRMISKANKYNLAIRPHFKTHQSAQIGKWFKELGVEEITVSSIQMAEYFADNGWSKITIAFPVNIRALEQLKKLSEKCSLTILISDFNVLNTIKTKLDFSINSFIEIDTGYGRTGFKPKNLEHINELIEFCGKSQFLTFRGFYTHNGHTYKTKETPEIEKIHNKSIKELRSLYNQFSEKYPKLEIQLGDTPSCSVMEHFEYIDAICPGNFVFYDLTQAAIGSCKEEDISVVVACPVVSKDTSKQQLVIHGGGVHFSKDKLEVEGRTIFGKIVKLDKEGWGKPVSETYLISLSQEHGTVQASKDFFDEIQIGDLVYILPVHSCLTANLHSQYITTAEEVITRMPRI